MPDRDFWEWIAEVHHRRRQRGAARKVWTLLLLSVWEE